MSEQPNQPSANRDEELEQGAQPEATSEQDSAETVEQTTDGEQQQLQELQSKLEQAEATVVEQQESVLRAKAEVENVRRRAAQDVEKAHKFALEKFAQELLPVIDNLERALQAGEGVDESAQPIIEGVDLTLKSFAGVLEKFGLEAINPENEAFNPEHHQAMAMQPSADHKPNTVLNVMQKGYLLNGRLLRPAMVVVSKSAE